MVHGDNLHKDVSVAISRDESVKFVQPTSNNDRRASPHPPETIREKLKNLIQSRNFQKAVVLLVVTDCILVVSELMLDVNIIELHKEDHMAPHVLHYMSIAILSVFMVEILVRFYALGLDVFHHKLQLFDAFIVIMSFSLDVAFQDPEHLASYGFGLVITLRLWRVARILNGIVLSVKSQSEHKLSKEREMREDIKQELTRYKEYTSALENEIFLLRKFLTEHRFDFDELPHTVVRKLSQLSNTVNVLAEVNSNPLECG